MHGHQDHFLSRLDRVDGAQIELALRLYNDVDLVRYVLDHASLPPGDDRVAISLDDPTLGPFLIVTRQGDFVTCLARGMRCRERPVVQRQRLDELLTRSARARARLAIVCEHIGPRLDLRRIARAITGVGGGTSREAIAAAVAFGALLGCDHAHAAACIVAIWARIVVRPEPRTGRRRAHSSEELSLLWDTAHAAVNHRVLVGASEATALPEAANALEERPQTCSLGFVCMGLSSIALRALWGAGRTGHSPFAEYERGFGSAEARIDIIDGALGMAIIALRQPHLRRRAGELFEAAIERGGTSGADRLERTAARCAGEALRVLHGRAAPTVARELGARAIIAMRRDLHHTSRHRFWRCEDVPDSLALAASLDAIGDLRSISLGACFDLVPWLACAEPEDLYLPEEMAATRRQRAVVRQGMRLLRTIVEHAPDNESGRGSAAQPARPGARALRAAQSTALAPRTAA